jgi:hypothetical protein
MGGGVVLRKLKKFTVCMTDEQQREILEMRKTDEYCRCSLSEIARNVFDRGIKAYLDEKERSGKTA